VRHFLSIKEYSKEELLEIIDLGLKIKREIKAGEFVHRMKNKTLAMIFEKNSTRTRVSFEVGIYQLGGVGLFLSSRDLQLGRGEPIKDTARVISSMCDMVMIRTYEHAKLEEFAKYSKVPVINGLSDSYHPVQLMADYMTMVECGKDKNPVVAYIGDGNNMAHSWINLAAKLGFEMRIATPVGYECDETIIAEAMETASKSGARLMFTHNPKEAASGADILTTDVWTSMGQEEEYQKRVKAFQGFIIDSDLMKLAKPDALFLHCLPAHRGEEVSDEVIESAQSAVWQEAENRLHAQKGIMVWLDQSRGD
jgi:ornithine carbamoyltransferase